MSSNPQVTIGVTAVDKASGVLRSLDQQVVGTTSKIDQSNAQAAKSTERTSSSMIKSYSSIAASVASLGAGVISFVTSFGTLEKAQNRVDTANLTLQKSQASLEKLQASGTASAEKLAIAQEDVRVKTNLLNQAQGDLADTTMNFYAQMPAQLISFGTAATSALAAYSAGAKGATISTTTLGHAFKVAMLGPPPIGLILTGVGIAATLVATHFDEISAALQYTGKVVHDFLTQHFKPLGDLIQWFIDGLNALGAGLTHETIPATNEYASATDKAYVAVKQVNKELETYQDWLVKTGQATIETTTENTHYLRSLGVLNNVLGESNERINLLADYLQDLEQEKTRQIESNFKLVASEISWQNAIKLSNDELQKQADALRKVNEESTKSSDSKSSFSSEPFSSPMHYSSIAKFGSVENYLESKASRATRIEFERIDKMARRGTDIGGYQTTQPNVFVTVNDFGNQYEVEVRSGSSIRTFRAQKHATTSLPRY